jgi:hypothetical protein
MFFWKFTFPGPRRFGRGRRCFATEFWMPHLESRPFPLHLLRRDLRCLHLLGRDFRLNRLKCWSRKRQLSKFLNMTM